MPRCNYQVSYISSLKRAFHINTEFPGVCALSGIHPIRIGGAAVSSFVPTHLLEAHQPTLLCLLVSELQDTLGEQKLLQKALSGEVKTVKEELQELQLMVVEDEAQAAKLRM